MKDVVRHIHVDHWPDFETSGSSLPLAVYLCFCAFYFLAKLILKIYQIVNFTQALDRAKPDTENPKKMGHNASFKRLVRHENANIDPLNQAVMNLSLSC